MGGSGSRRWFSEFADVSDACDDDGEYLVMTPDGGAVRRVALTQGGARRSPLPTLARECSSRQSPPRERASGYSVASLRGSRWAGFCPHSLNNTTNAQRFSEACEPRAPPNPRQYWAERARGGDAARLMLRPLWNLGKSFRGGALGSATRADRGRSGFPGDACRVSEGPRPVQRDRCGPCGPGPAFPWRNYPLPPPSRGGRSYLPKREGRAVE